MNEPINPLELLSATPLFEGMPAEVLRSIQSATHQAVYPKGKVIFCKGDRGDAIYLVLEGRVRLSVVTAAGRELTFSHAAVGDLFGEIAVLDGSPRSADATALGDVRVQVLPAVAFERFLDRYSELSRGVIRLLCARLRTVSDHLEDIALLPIEARLARFLLSQLQPGANGSSPASRRATLGISQGEIALLLGASRPKINAALMLLEQEGAIVRSGQTIDCAPAVLARIARLA